MAGPTPSPGPAISAQVVTSTFGDVTVLNDVSIEANGDGLVAPIGPIGVDKSSLLNVLSGFYVPKTGRAAFGAI